ncbi:unnamed protein product, partial [marine sediment metagenome]
MAYGRTNVETARAAQERVGRDKFWSPKEGKNRVRILPPWGPDVDRFWHEWWIHWGVGPRNMPVVCLAKYNRTPCHICEVIKALQTSQVDEDAKQADDMKANLSVLYNILPLDVAEPSVQVMRTGPQIFEGILGYVTDPDWGNIDDPQEGFD